MVCTKTIPVFVPLHCRPFKENGNQITIKQTLNRYPRTCIAWTLNGSHTEASVLFHSVLHTFVCMYGFQTFARMCDYTHV